MSYEVTALRREEKIKYDAGKLDEKELMESLKKRTRYRSMSIKK
jgi:hypothetical protein